MSAEPHLPEMSDSAVARRLLGTYLAPRWGAVVIAAAFAIIFAATSTALFKLLQPAVNDLKVLQPGARLPNLSVALKWPLVMLALVLVRTLVQVGQARITNAVGNGIVGDVQVELFGKLMRADLARLRASHTGGFVSQVLYDAGLIREAATSGVLVFVQQSLVVIGALVVMLTADWRLGLAVLLIGPVVGVVQRRYGRMTSQASRGAMAATAALSTLMMESLDGVRVVKMENREAFEEARMAAAVRERQRHIISGDNARATAAPVSEMLLMTVAALVLAYEGWQATQGRLDPGAFVAFFAALLAAAQSLRQVTNQLTVMQQGLPAARRLFAALDVEPEVRDALGAAALEPGEATLRLEEVSFAYGAAPVLRGVTLEARRGEIIALVGPSGAGKTTVLNLIPRFYDVTTGAVTVDGTDVRTVALASLRDQIALVTQEPFLFDDSIAANISYARPQASRAEVEAAARAAAAHGFITELPKGYDSGVGEAGARLSGGQRQRIAIARAFLKNAPILLLDEATSALDTESEAQVQAALERLMAGRTTILIAHRLSTVRGASRIYVLDAGRVVETGGHAELVKKGGLYARLARSQDLEGAGEPTPEAAE
jgi:subfamily B ATP-binding cassette protein MsbA